MRVSRKTNIQVVIEPNIDGFWFNNKTPEEKEKLFIREAERIRDEVNHHIDDFSSVSIDWDNSIECSFCGYSFDDTETKELMPLCCEEAQIEYVKDNPDYDGKVDDMEELVKVWRKELLNA